MQQPSGDSSSDAMAQLGCRLSHIPGCKKCRNMQKPYWIGYACVKHCQAVGKADTSRATMINVFHFVFLALRRRRLLVPVGKHRLQGSGV